MKLEVALAKLAAENHKTAQTTAGASPTGIPSGTGGSRPMPAPKPLGTTAPNLRPLGAAPAPVGAVPAPPRAAPLGAGARPAPAPPPAAPPPAAPPPAPAGGGGGILDSVLGAARGMQPEQLGQLMAGFAPVTKAVAGVGGLPALAGITDLIRGGGNMQTLLRGPGG